MMSDRHIPVQRWPWIWAAICIVMVFAIAGLSVALVSIRQSNSTANCLQRTLQDHSGPTAADQSAHVAFAKALDELLSVGAEPPAQQRAAVVRFKRAVDTYVATLDRDEALRDRHAFEQC